MNKFKTEQLNVIGAWGLPFLGKVSFEDLNCFYGTLMCRLRQTVAQKACNGFLNAFIIAFIVITINNIKYCDKLLGPCCASLY